MTEDLSGLTVAELKARLKARGAKVSGNKSVLIARLEALLDADAGEGGDDAVEDADGDFVLVDDDEQLDGDDSVDVIEADVIEAAVMEADVMEADVMEAEVLDAAIIEAEVIEAEPSETAADGRRAPTQTGTNTSPGGRNVGRGSARGDGPPFWQQPTAVATLLIVLLLAGAGGWWWMMQTATAYQAAPPNYGDQMTFSIESGSIEATGDEMVAYLRDASGGALDDICERLTLDYSGTGHVRYTRGTLSDIIDPADSHLEGAVMARGPYGRLWMTAQHELGYDLDAGISGRSWSQIDADKCSSLEFNKPGNDLDLSVTRWNELSERSLLRTASTLDFRDADGAHSAVSATTFGPTGSTAALDDLMQVVTLPMQPIDLYEVFGIKVLEKDLTGDHNGWQYRVGDTAHISAGEARVVYLDHTEAKKCLGHATITLWVLPGQPWPAQQSVDVALSKDGGSTSDCGTVTSSALELAMPDGRLTARYTLIQTGFTAGDDSIDWGATYIGRPSTGSGVPAEEDQVVWAAATHMPDLSADRAFTLEEAVVCVQNESGSGSAGAALSSGGYVFAASDDRSSSVPVWNLSWVTSEEAGYIRVGEDAEDNCVFFGDGPLAGDAKPEFSREDIPETLTLSDLEARSTDADRYPALSGLVMSGGSLRADASIGYALTVPEQNDLWDLLPDEYRQGQVSHTLTREWSEGGDDLHLRAAMDAERARMIGWVVTTTASD